MPTVTVECSISAPLSKVWELWTTPEHIVRWAFASDDWEAPRAENDLRVGGKFTTVMAAKDKSASFDFTGVYTKVKEHELVAYILDDGRNVSVQFQPAGGERYSDRNFRTRTRKSAGGAAIRLASHAR